MTTHAPIPTVRRAAVRLLAAALLAGLGATAVAGDDEHVQFGLQPVDSTVVAGHVLAFQVEAYLHPSTAEYQWYRNDVAIAGATGQAYRFTAQSADDGAHYHVAARGNDLFSSKASTTAGAAMPAPGRVVGPTPSRQVTLTVLPAGANLTPAMTVPAAGTLRYLSAESTGDPRPTYGEFRATGNDLEWSYRFDIDEPDYAWHLLPAPTLGAQAVNFNYAPPAKAAVSLTVRVVDAAGVVATRTWPLAGGLPVPPQPVIFSAGPGDSTVVAGHAVAFVTYSNIVSDGQYQWYRNDVAIPAATAATYSFTAQAADHGARYHVVASGRDKTGALVPTPSPKATLTVLPAGSALTPEIVAPEGNSLYYTPPADPAAAVTVTGAFRASGNHLTWAYRYAEDTAGTWRAMDATTTGLQYLRISFSFPAAAPSASVTVRVVDDASVTAARTWSFVANRPPTVALAVTPNPVVWPGPVTLSVTASDPDGDPLTYVWFVDYYATAGGGDAVFTPSGNTCTATFTKFGTYRIYAGALDGKGGYADSSSDIVVEPNFDVRADLNHDGVVNTLDLGIVVDSFGQVIP